MMHPDNMEVLFVSEAVVPVGSRWQIRGVSQNQDVRCQKK